MGLLYGGSVSSVWMIISQKRKVTLRPLRFAAQKDCETAPRDSLHLTPLLSVPLTAAPPPAGWAVELSC